MEKRNSKVIKFLSALMKQIRQAGIPEYSSKFSPRKYTQRQLICLLALRRYFRKSYRDFVEILSTMDSVIEFLNLSAIPHFTTLQKAFQRIGNLWIILRIQTRSFRRERLEFVAVDSTGFSDPYSVYYRKRLEDFGEVRGWKKVAIGVDGKGHVLSCYFGEGIESDFMHMKHLLRQMRKAGIRTRYVIADKGYDSSNNRQLIRDVSGIPVIPIRHLTDLHRKADKEFVERWKDVYGKRNVAESVFSAMKRRFGGEIWSRKEELKFKELLLVVVAYNAWKILFLVGVFYNAKQAKARHICLTWRIGRNLSFPNTLLLSKNI